MRISDWSSDVCSSDLVDARGARADVEVRAGRGDAADERGDVVDIVGDVCRRGAFDILRIEHGERGRGAETVALDAAAGDGDFGIGVRSEDHTSELQSLMRISYAVLCFESHNKKYNMLHRSNLHN